MNSFTAYFIIFICSSFSLLVDEPQELGVHAILIGDLDYAGALLHDISLLYSASSFNVVSDCHPLLLFDHHVLAPFVEDADHTFLFLKGLDILNEFFGG